MQSTLLSEIEAFLATHGMAETTFGRWALEGDWRLVRELRGEATKHGRPRRLWPETEAKIRQKMATYRPGDERAAKADVVTEKAA